MNPQNLTQKSLEAVQTAQSMALENRNNYIMPEHLLYALVDQDGGLIPSLLGKMGVDCNTVLAELDSASAALPLVLICQRPSGCARTLPQPLSST